MYREICSNSNCMWQWYDSGGEDVDSSDSECDFPLALLFDRESNDY